MRRHFSAAILSFLFWIPVALYLLYHDRPRTVIGLFVNFGLYTFGFSYPCPHLA